MTIAIPTTQKQGHHPLKVGIIPFWNLYPLKVELQKQKFKDLTLMSGPPSQVNQWLSEGVCDIAPCSSVCLALQPDFEMALPLGIAASGPVKSVYLGFHHEHQYILDHMATVEASITTLFRQSIANSPGDHRKIAQNLWSTLDLIAPLDAYRPIPIIKFPSASASSVMLSKLFYRMFFGKEAYQTVTNRNFAVGASFADRKPIELLIGDEALAKRRSFYKIVDLSTLWKDITGLPFVFAVWQSKGACLNGWRRKILTVGELAENKMKVHPASYIPQHVPMDDQGKPISLADYWKLINYRLGPQEFRGLLLFLCLTRHLQEMPLGESLAVKIARWQELIQAGTLSSGATH